MRESSLGSTPIDPDVGSFSEPHRLIAVAVVGLGGIVGATARYEVALAWPVPSGAFPWTTLSTNVVGSLLLSVVIVAITGRTASRALLRAALGAGMLGGFTTFSTFSVEQQRLLRDGELGTTVAYALATVGGCVIATSIGLRVARRLLLRRSR